MTHRKFAMEIVSPLHSNYMTPEQAYRESELRARSSDMYVEGNVRYHSSRKSAGFKTIAAICALFIAGMVCMCYSK